MNYFIGDLHLFNRNQTGEGVNYDGRPFATVAEMNQYIIEHWNAKITNGDMVPSSNWSGRKPLKLVMLGSSPAGITIII